RNLPEVYAREAKALHDDPVRTLKLQAIRVGDFAIAAIPNEVYAITGLKIKARSPLPSTFTIELANGSEGYIPPPEQHVLGGYTTWPARTAALEVSAEPRIVETVLGLLERVSGKPRRREASSPSAAAGAIASAGPWGFWRLDEMDGRLPRDASGHGRDARLEDGFALYLEGAEDSGRAVHLAGGRLVLPTVGLDPSRGFVLSFSFWNGLPADARGVCGTLVDVGGGAIRVEIGGQSGATGRLRLTAGGTTAEGKGTIAPKRWHRLTIASDGASVTARLDGAEDAVVAASPKLAAGASIALGGADDPSTRFEGKLDEVALFDRAPDADLVGRAEGRRR
ncbi:MAG: LamG domain-containing protein, partial [Thermoleophilia bacterium]|nr:LamG domain-containing protein [Thermoleophilia bacterium]